MNEDIAAAMRRAARATRANDVAEATHIIRESLGNPPYAGGTDIPSSVTPSGGNMWADELAKMRFADRPRRSLAEVLEALRKNCPLPGGGLGEMRAPVAPPIPEGARYLARSFACSAGSRDYRLYVPASARSGSRGLLVMLHGCKQDPDDFAVGTDMNAVAEANGLLVAYPGQPGTANMSSCWNWFNPGDQKRGAGEPAILSGLTRSVAAEFGIRPSRTFVAGLSAGGAMAAVMGSAYPDLYAAMGIHSGLACGSASDVVSAFAAMRGETVHPPAASRIPAVGPNVRTIVFHGAADRTVHPSNAERIVDAAFLEKGTSARRRDRGRSAGGRSYTRTVVLGEEGTPLLESWLVEGAGHAWSGGRPAGSYTDPAGPDASTEMVRFFLNSDRSNTNGPMY